MTLYTIYFPHGKMSPRSHKMSQPLSVVLLTPSLEVRLDAITRLIQEAAMKRRLGAVRVDIGTHGGTVWASNADIPLSTFTIDPPLERNG